jgi:MFS family permease
VGAVLAASAMPVSGLVADKFGRRNTLGTLAALIGLFSCFVPTLMDGGGRPARTPSSWSASCCWACRTARPPAP